MAKFAQVILPLPIYSTFSYSVPADFVDEIAVGSRVLVQFGNKNCYTGIVESIDNVAPLGYEVKPIISILDSTPILRYPQLKFWSWIADYYLCSPGDVFKAALPSGLKVESETYVELNPDFDVEQHDKLTERMAVIKQLLSVRKKMRIIDIEREYGLKHIGQTINSMLEIGCVVVSERIVDKYVAKHEDVVCLNCNRGDEKRLHEMFDSVKRSTKQEKLLMAFLDMSGWLQKGKLNDVKRLDLREKVDASYAVMKAMVDKGIFSVEKREVNRFKIDVGAIAKLPELTSIQLKAYNEIINSWTRNKVTLLRGVTGSGKTEIYSHLIQSVLERGEQVLFLVPEISLTTQLTTRLRKIFGQKLLVYHSKFSDNERVDIWKKILSTHNPLIVLGVRSSVFLPFAKLGLVIVDEEHESSYKQYDPAPRYNARDLAIVLSAMHGAKTLLGSATPSIETYYKAKEAKYGLVELTQRYDDAKMPDVEVIDMCGQRRKKENKGIFSAPLLSAIDADLKQGKQTIIFQNRRGFAPVVVCKECGWTPKCVNCDVSLVYHKRTNELRCHYCGHTITLPKICPACGLNGVEIFGYGTERIAEDLSEIFSSSTIERMDLDTTRNKESYQEIIDRFENKETDILVGTQMVSKGLDFDSVGIVGILNADTMLNFPDFRSNERAFNMMEQVAGRAGRRHDEGKVFIQTTDPGNETIAKVVDHDYMSYYQKEIADRRQFNYPPFTKVINIYLKHKNEQTVDQIAVAYTLALRRVFGNRVLGPEKPFVSRVATYYLQTIMLKIEANASMKKVKLLLRQIYESMLDDKRMKTVGIYYDVDPV